MTSLLGVGVQSRRDDIVVRRRGFNVSAMTSLLGVGGSTSAR